MLEGLRLRTLLSRITAARALLIDNLDAAVSSRLAAASYTAPDNAGIAAIKAKTDNLPASPAAQGNLADIDYLKRTTVTGTGVAGSIVALVDAIKTAVDAIKSTVDTNLNATVSSRMAAASYKDPDTTALSGTPTTDALTDFLRSLEKRSAATGVAGSIAGLINAVKTKTDALPASPANESTSTAIKAKTDNLPAAPASQAHAEAGATVPAADATTNTNSRDVLGNKSDAAPAVGTAANSTLSVAAYIKALWNLLRSVTWSHIDAAISSRASATTAPSWFFTKTTPGGFYPGVDVAGSGSSGVFSSWVEIEDSTPAALELTSVTVYTPNNVTAGFEVDIGTGAAGAESSIGSVTGRHNVASNVFVIPIPRPISVASGTRVAVRIKLNSTSATQYHVAVNYLR